MGFLDDLENSLKGLEAQEERDGAANLRRKDERERTLAAAPFFEQLRSSDYVKQLYDKAAVAGHRFRMKVYMAWLDTTLRLEARERRLELKPTVDGIIAEFIEPDGTSRVQPIDLRDDPQKLLDQWLG
jgi:hypothetical protein